jgi:hypothetical protein
VTWISGACLPSPGVAARRAAMAEAMRWRNAARWALALWTATWWVGWALVTIAFAKLAEVWCGIYWLHIRDA